MNIQIRQGDVALVRVRLIPKEARAIKRNGVIVLAHGEATGHAHTIAEPSVELYERDGVMYLRVHDGGAVVEHQEHAAITVEPGIYKVQRQCEYAPEQIRRVAD